MDKMVNVLWTGGWDSTFRIIELLQTTNAVIQPHYVVDPERSSSDIELKTMGQIKKSLVKRLPGVERRLLPPIVAHREDIPPDDRVTAALDHLRTVGHVGKQYSWLARYACHLAYVPLDLNIEKTDLATDLIRDHLVPANNTYSRYCIADHGDAVTTLFSHFLFPLVDTDKPRMRARVSEWDMNAIMDKTWFCHSPLPGGYACGTCRPCVYVMDKGQAWRMGFRGRARYALIERTRRRLSPSVKSWLRERAGRRIRHWFRA